MGSKRALSTTHPLEPDVVVGAAAETGAATTSARAATAMLPTTGPPTRSLRPIGAGSVPRSAICPLSGVVRRQLVVVPLGRLHEHGAVWCHGDAVGEPPGRLQALAPPSGARHQDLAVVQ